MFEKKKKELFPWKISALILVGVFVLSSGVYIGTRLKHNGVQTGEVVSTSANMNEKSKEAFGLNKNCEVWLQSEGENETNYKRTLTMAGIVPESLLDKTKSEIVDTVCVNSWQSSCCRSPTPPAQNHRRQIRSA